MPACAGPVDNILLLSSGLVLVPRRETGVFVSVLMTRCSGRGAACASNMATGITGQARGHLFRAVTNGRVGYAMREGNGSFIFSLRKGKTFNGMSFSRSSTSSLSSSRGCSRGTGLRNGVVDCPLLTATGALHGVGPMSTNFPSFAPRLRTGTPLTLLVARDLGLNGNNVICCGNKDDSCRGLGGTTTGLNLAGVKRSGRSNCVTMGFCSTGGGVLVALRCSPRTANTASGGAFRSVSRCTPVCVVMLSNMARRTLHTVVRSTSSAHDAQMATHGRLGLVSGYGFSNFGGGGVFGGLTHLHWFACVYGMGS